MSVQILVGDAQARLAEITASSVRCCVTSPPYYGLRDYGVAGQIGLEATPDEFVAVLVAVFRDVRRVLADDGTLWLNLGDSYAGSWGAQGRQGATGQMAGRSVVSARQIEAHPHRQSNTGTIRQLGIKPKDLIGIPWRVAFALQADGWYLRSDIIWSKPNPMPESVTDRPTKAHEYLFLLAKSERYYYDAAAIAEESVSDHDSGNGFVRSERINSGRGSDDQWRRRVTRNRRTVWTIATRPFAQAHFATFPTALIQPCIMAGSAKGDMVLDPFGGAGTTGLVANQLGRNATLIELNPTYAEMARLRIHNDAPLMSDVRLSA